MHCILPAIDRKEKRGRIFKSHEGLLLPRTSHEAVLHTRQLASSITASNSNSFIHNLLSSGQYISRPFLRPPPPLPHIPTGPLQQNDIRRIFSRESLQETDGNRWENSSVSFLPTLTLQNAPSHCFPLALHTPRLLLPHFRFRNRHHCYFQRKREGEKEIEKA